MLEDLFCFAREHFWPLSIEPSPNERRPSTRVALLDWLLSLARKIHSVTFSSSLPHTCRGKGGR